MCVPLVWLLFLHTLGFGIESETIVSGIMMQASAADTRGMSDSSLGHSCMMTMDFNQGSSHYCTSSLDFLHPIVPSLSCSLSISLSQSYLALLILFLIQAGIKVNYRASLLLDGLHS